MKSTLFYTILISFLFAIFEISRSVKRNKIRNEAAQIADENSEYLLKSYEFYKMFENDNQGFTENLENKNKYKSGKNISDYMVRTESNLIDTIEQFNSVKIDKLFGNGYFYSNTLNK